MGSPGSPRPSCSPPPTTAVTINEVSLPDSPIYSLHDVERGDSMANWSPDEALPAILSAQRTPLTLTEGTFWLLRQPTALVERNHCFRSIGSRLRKDTGKLAARTPAVWISNGTGRDGSANAGAPKVGWCWAGNRHTWLGLASAGRGPQPAGRRSPRRDDDSPVTDRRAGRDSRRPDSEVQIAWRGSTGLRYRNRSAARRKPSLS